MQELVGPAAAGRLRGDVSRAADHPRPPKIAPDKERDFQTLRQTCVSDLKGDAFWAEAIASQPLRITLEKDTNEVWMAIAPEHAPQKPHRLPP